MQFSVLCSETGHEQLTHTLEYLLAAAISRLALISRFTGRSR